MKFATDRPFADPEKAARRIVEIASTVEPAQDGRIFVELKVRGGRLSEAQAILGAVAVVLREQRDEQRKINDELRAIIEGLTQRVEVVEQRGPPRSLRAIRE